MDNVCGKIGSIVSGGGEDMYKKLIAAALKARENSYSPYSGFRVGAALLTEDGTVYTGCNIENRAYGPTNCAERTAFFKAVSEGSRTFRAIAIAGGGDETVWCYPCGVCRQVMAEFCRPEKFEIICARSAQEYQIFTLEELLPKMF